MEGYVSDAERGEGEMKFRERVSIVALACATYVQQEVLRAAFSDSSHSLDIWTETTREDSANDGLVTTFWLDDPSEKLIPS